MKISCLLIIILMVITSWGQHAFSQERAGITISNQVKLDTIPPYFTFGQYQRLLNTKFKNNIWRKNSSIRLPEIKLPSLPERLFGSDSIQIKFRGEAEMSFLARLNRNENPLFYKKRTQLTFDLEPRMQMDVVAAVGDKLKVQVNYNTNAAFNFENQVKLDYSGAEDENIRKIEAGNVSFPLPTTLIQGAPSLFGLKTQLQFGKLLLTSVFSQQKSQTTVIHINNGAQQRTFSFSADQYQANQHYFIADYFRSRYNEALSHAPLVNSNIQITKVELWISNKTGRLQDARDLVAFLDLGENNPHHSQFTGGPGFSALPAAFESPAYPQKSNNLLSSLPTDARLANSNTLLSFFSGNNGNDNFARLTSARKLNDSEYSIHTQLGYISLNQALQGDEVLAIAFRYTANGQEYQVGEFSTDVPVDLHHPVALFVKMLKNETLNTELPIWNLMMKNIYSIGAEQLRSQNFKLDIYRVDEETGMEQAMITKGEKIDIETKTPLRNKRWLEVFRLDRLNQQNENKADGIFDYQTQAYATVDPLKGRIIFPVLAPFGADLHSQFYPSEQELIDKYTFSALYAVTQVIARQQYLKQNRFLIKGSYEADASADFPLNAVNVTAGSVKVFAGTMPLQEGLDFVVDYNRATVKILNAALLSSGQAITINTEGDETLGLQQRTLFGTRFDFRFNQQLNLGATWMKLSEKSLKRKVNLGEEPVSNTMWGLDLNYNMRSTVLSKPLDINFFAEYAQLIPGRGKFANRNARQDDVSYLDDFEAARIVIDLKNPATWQLSATPQRFPESQLIDNLAYGFNRARIAFYQIDPDFYSAKADDVPASLSKDRHELSRHAVRQVLEQEVFPFKELASRETQRLSTFDLAFYPTVRGPYNYSITGFNSDGSLRNPRSRWGGIFRQIDHRDFEALNIDYIEFWVMDPFLDRPANGGDLYISLGNLSEDILKDGRKSVENGLSGHADPSKYEETAWGRVPKLQPLINFFDNTPELRKAQDVGLDGLANAGERQKFASQVQQISRQLQPDLAAAFQEDPSSDDFQYYRGTALDQMNAGILKRYELYNGVEGNSTNAGITAIPDGEDVNRDNNMAQADAYFQYKISLRPADLMIGKKYVTDEVSSLVKLPNGQSKTVKWFQFRIPLHTFDQRIGGIQDFRSIRFIRLFMTDFTDTTVLRFAKLQLVKGDWRAYNAKNEAPFLIHAAMLKTGAPDQSIVNIATLNIEENGKRSPIPYVLPPGLERERDDQNQQGETQLNEQSLTLSVKHLRDGYGRAAFKNAFHDFRSYKRLEMDVHLETEGTPILNDHDLSAFLRIGSDFQDNYYEYVQPLKVTLAGATNPGEIWPDQNKMNIDLAHLPRAKLARNEARTAEGASWPSYLPFEYQDGVNTIIIKGQPDLSSIRVFLLGVINPLRQHETSAHDDGQDKDALLWFNELRLTGFDEKKGWAATARLNAKLADFAEVNISGLQSTIGFGTLGSRAAERNRADQYLFDVSSNLELGKLFPKTAGIKIPVYVSYSKDLSTPQYDPLMPDVELQKQILHDVQENTSHQRLSLNNVHKERVQPGQRPKLWDVENWSGSYAYTQQEHQGLMVKSALQRSYRAAIAYQYSEPAKVIAPFNEIIKSNMLALIRDFNFSLLPSSINFNVQLDRYYAENTLRDNSPGNSIPIHTTFNKNFLMTRVYGISWNLSRSLMLDFDATNYSIIDEPEGRVDGLKRDTLWQNLKRLGRTADYNHNLNITYQVPLHKIPGLHWINLATRYGSNFYWQTEPLVTLCDPAIDLGNNIQNSRTIQLNPSLNFERLYSLFGAKNNGALKQFGLLNTLTSMLTSIRTVNMAYTQTKGIYLPGYLPASRYLGIDDVNGAPGLGFVLGSQQNIIETAVNKGWLTTDSLQSQLYVNTLREDFSLNGMLEPIPGFRVTIIANRNRTLNRSVHLKYHKGEEQFEAMSPQNSGDYSMTFLTLKTAFSEERGSLISAVYERFMNNRELISQRLGARNPNSRGVTNGYADGYQKSSQDVVMAAFLAAYTGRDARASALNSLPKIPLPNWRVNYSGLIKIPFLQENFKSIDLRHSYSAVYRVNGFNSMLKYAEDKGFVSSRDANENFLPYYQYGQVTIAEEFSPLIGVDVRLKSNLTTNFEIGKGRMLGLSLSNSQLAQLMEHHIIVGIGYRNAHFRLPLGLMRSVKSTNQMDAKLDLVVRDHKTVIYRADALSAEIAAGAKNIMLRPSVNYILNERYSIKLFYDSNVTKPYTSATFETAYSNFGFSIRILVN